MGQVLRLDGRIEIEDQEAAAVGVVTRAAYGASTGRLWAIRRHDKPELRLIQWGRGKPIRPTSMDVYLGDGTFDYHDLPAGIYEAESRTTRVDQLVARVVFAVAGDRAEVLARSKAEHDRVIAALAGWDVPRLLAERDAYDAELARVAAELGFAPLRGSAAVCRWANQLRPVKYEHAAAYLADRRAELAALEAAEAENHVRLPVELAVGWLAYALPLLLAEADAGWWAARCSMPGVDILRKLAKHCRDGATVGAGGRAGR